jgi:hypothetical protein
MIGGIDHLVIACADPDAAASELESTLGIVAGGGGRHEGHGSWNRIAWLADGSYLELIGIDDASLAGQSPVGAAAIRALEEHGGGLATFALRTDDLEATVAGLRAGASSFGQVVPGSRARDDGEVVQWWTSVPEATLSTTLPFLIEHAYSGAEWGADALAERAGFRHPIGSPVILARLDLAAAEPAAAAAGLHDELGIDFWAVADLAVADVGPHVIRLVPRREMPVPAVIVLGAEIDTPRTAHLLGLRFDVERVELPVGAPQSA